MNVCTFLRIWCSIFLFFISFIASTSTPLFLSYGVICLWAVAINRNRWVLKPKLQCALTAAVFGKRVRRFLFCFLVVLFFCFFVVDIPTLLPLCRCLSQHYETALARIPRPSSHAVEIRPHLLPHNFTRKSLHRRHACQGHESEEEEDVHGALVVDVVVGLSCPCWKRAALREPCSCPTAAWAPSACAFCTCC